MYDLCLITTPTPELEDDRLEPPLGLLYLASYIKKNNPFINVQIIDLCQVPESQWEIPESRFYGFTTYTTTYHRTLEIKNKIKSMYPKAKTIAGGAHASALPDIVADDFDCVVIGEGEITTYNIINGCVADNIVEGTKVNILDTLPYPDYDMVDFNSYHRIVDGKKSFSILSSRGCPYKCAFCNSIILGGRHKVRFRSPDHVVGEIKQLLDKYGDVNFRFQDDIFGANINWLREYTNKVRHLKIVYRAFVRATQCANKEFVQLLSDGGCRHISLGIESGSDIILRNMNKDQTKKICIEALRNAKEEGLIRRIYLIVGFPGETWDTINETVEFVQQAQPDEFVVYPLIPYPGTPLWHNADAFGLRNLDKDFSKYFQIYGNKQSHFVYDLDNADRYELQAMKDYLVSEIERSHSIWAIESKGYK